MLQASEHARKASCKSTRDYQMWKALFPKGLCEIEEIEKEEVSTKLMQSLERFMREYPAIWSESSMQHLLVEIADTQYASSSNSVAEERLHTIIMHILVPMAKIMEAEQGHMKAERQKIHEATLSLQRVQDECNNALLALTQEHDRSARIAAEQAGRRLTEKEKQIHGMLQKQRDTLVRLVCGGPRRFLHWAREEIQFHGMVELEKDLEQVWYSISRALYHEENTTPNAPECSSCTSYEQGKDEAAQTNRAVFKNGEKSSTLPMSMTDLAVNLLSLVVSEIWQQTLESYERVKSPFSLPCAIIGFWFGIAARMTYLALVTLCPQVVFRGPYPEWPLQ
ncbi:uncharacterized protein [Physcomitrium patens]|uniref:uncharacterized protein isoform X2 n=1 Tax=Physcomitrium patens TaxID=3218 RepID=UPI000D17C118|nr:uncharacterized protein LOC112278514 isoform X2 [Physcomitrium patens]|eukprot:XP_024367881.1 uncharacterized protein LOC112278514 isoform X2 [Physcomitrella patens]